MSNLYIIATPIGNLEDITFRALRILKEVDLVLCEDTRQTQKLFSHYNITTPTLSYHQHSKLQKVDYILDILKSGKNLALVSDAGTPGISDPGNQLVNLAANKISDLVVIPIPGPSALISAGSVSGFPVDKFIFMGFPPIKNKREKFFKELASLKYPVIFYESPYRIIKTLMQLKNEFEKQKLDPDVIVCREITKMFETIYRGKINKAIEDINKGEIKGEFTVIINLPC